MVCDRKVGLPARVKGKVYKVAVRPAMLYGLDTVALTKRQEAEMEVTELKMLRFSLGVTIMDTIRNESSEGQHRWESLERKQERQYWMVWSQEPAWCRLCFGSMLKQTSMQRFFGYAYPCQIIVCNILVL